MVVPLQVLSTVNMIVPYWLGHRELESSSLGWGTVFLKTVLKQDCVVGVLRLHLKSPYPDVSC